MHQQQVLLLYKSINKTMIVAIIPARSGSKRIPQKNIKPFAGKPIIAYSIVAAKASGIFDKIIVSTDSEQIAQIARGYGAEVPFLRPTELSDDMTGIDAVVIHALKHLRSQSCSLDYVCCIAATAPFVRAQDIRRGFETLKTKDASSLVSVTTFPYPILRALKLNEKGFLEFCWPEHRKTRSQDLPETYHDAAQFYWANAKAYLHQQSFLSTDTIPFVLPRYLVQDIDTLEDWETAEKMHKVQEF